MNETRTIRDPFLNKTVEISDRLTDRLRGRYAVGPTMPNGEPEFGWDEFPSSPIQKEAADEIDRLSSRETLLDSVVQRQSLALMTIRTMQGDQFEPARKIAREAMDAGDQ